jgi:hypothetical protein
MNKYLIPALFAATVLASVSARAEDAKPGMMMKMMEGGEVVAIMPDGHMGTMKVTDEKMMGEMMKMAKPMDHCMMIMTGADGKAMMVDTSTPEAMKECEKMAM